MVSQDDRWNQHYAEVKSFIKANHRLPSKHRIEDHRLLNWLKYNKKLIATGRMSPERKQQFDKLMQYALRYLRINQYAYVRPPRKKSGNQVTTTQLTLFDS